MEFIFYDLVLDLHGMQILFLGLIYQVSYWVHILFKIPLVSGI